MRYVAFLSRLPVGPQAVSMDTLRKLFMKLGFLDVEPYLDTGNVAFETRPVGVIGPLEAQISRHLKNHIDADIWTFIRTPEELARISAHEAFLREELDSNAGATFIVFLPEPLSARAERQLRMQRSPSDVLHAKGTEIYWIRRTADGGAATPPPVITELLETRATVRSARTVRVLSEKYSPVVRSSSKQAEKSR